MEFGKFHQFMGLIFTNFPAKKYFFLTKILFVLLKKHEAKAAGWVELGLTIEISLSYLCFNWLKHR
ncbi:MAG: hypothetical protein ACRC4N_17295 [Gammaproteobacteria bacterium]